MQANPYQKMGISNHPIGPPLRIISSCFLYSGGYVKITSKYNIGGGGFRLDLRLQSFSFSNGGPHANLRTILSGRKVTSVERKEKEIQKMVEICLQRPRLRKHFAIFTSILVMETLVVNVQMICILT